MASGDPVPKPPLEAARFAKLKPKTKKVSGTFYRLSRKEFPTGLFYSKRGALRFDSPTARWGVCYCAREIVTCFQEVFGDYVLDDIPILFEWLEAYDVWEFQLPEIASLPLSDRNMTRLRASMQCFVNGYALSQEWGRAIMNHPLNVDAITFTSRKAATESMALLGAVKKPLRAWQPAVTEKRLGPLVLWDQFYDMIDDLDVMVDNVPASDSGPVWSL